MKLNLRTLAAAATLAAACGLPALAADDTAEPVQLAQATNAQCRDMTLAIYFRAFDSTLTPQSEEVIAEAGQQLQGCQITAVSVNVLSEEAHTDEDAALLSEARADSVMESILDHGIDAGAYEADYSRLAVTAPSAKRMAEPMARRVNVAIEVQPRVGV